jgi:hypothetical protein
MNILQDYPEDKIKLWVGIIYHWMNIETQKPYVGQSRTCKINRYTTDANEILYHRFKCHCSDSKHSDTYFHKAIKKYGIDKFVPTIVSIHEAETKEQLIAILDEEEIKNIAQLDTLAPNGYNLMSGGSSPVFHIDTRKKMSEKKQAFLKTAEGRLWIESVKEAKAELYKTDKGKQQAKNHGENISNKYKAEPELIEQIRRSVLLYNESAEGQERRATHSQWMKSFMTSPEGNVFKQHLSACAKKRWEDEAYRQNQSTIGKERFEGEEGKERRAKASKSATKRMANPDNRKKISDTLVAKALEKGHVYYKCEACGYENKDKYSYDRHCESKRHMLLVSGLSKEDAEKKAREETAMKISKANILHAQTHTNPQKGKRHTDEAKEKNRKAHLGKKHSDSSKQQLSDKIKSQYEKGERKNGNALLTDEQVLYVRANRGKILQKDIASQLNISVQTVSAIQNDKIYRHVKPINIMTNQ